MVFDNSVAYVHSTEPWLSLATRCQLGASQTLTIRIISTYYISCVLPTMLASGVLSPVVLQLNALSCKDGMFVSFYMRQGGGGQSKGEAPRDNNKNSSSCER